MLCRLLIWKGYLKGLVSFSLVAGKLILDNVRQIVSFLFAFYHMASSTKFKITFNSIISISEQLRPLIFSNLLSKT
jgi:hypothetical protein